MTTLEDLKKTELETRKLIPNISRPHQAHSRKKLPESSKHLGVFYIRVSTKEQGDRRNGLEAQKEDIERFSFSHDITNIAPNNQFFEEVVSGGAPLYKRPVLVEAIDFAKKNGAFLITSKLDRLSRHATMISEFLDQDLKFTTVEFGFNADPFVLRIMVGVAQKEREMISQRTKAALAIVAKTKKLGIPDVANAPTHISHVTKGESLLFVKNSFLPHYNFVLNELSLASGSAPNNQMIANKLNEIGFESPTGLIWNRKNVHRYKKCAIDNGLLTSGL